MRRWMGLRLTSTRLGRDRTFSRSMSTSTPAASARSAAGPGPRPAWLPTPRRGRSSPARAAAPPPPLPPDRSAASRAPAVAARPPGRAASAGRSQKAHAARLRGPDPSSVGQPIADHHHVGDARQLSPSPATIWNRRSPAMTSMLGIRARGSPRPWHWTGATGVSGRWS
jgi:hypothetical protein